MIVTVTLLIVFSSALRYVPHLLVNGLGVDHWFWKCYVRASREQRRFPPELPAYVLDEHQWYPPVFPLALALCPWTLSERGSRLLPIAVDAMRLMLLLATVGW